MTTFYVSGPMTGRPEFNFPAFDSCSAWLRACGYGVISPADHDREVARAAGASAPETFDGYADGDLVRYHKAMGTSFVALLGWDLAQIASPECDGIVMLPGWVNSTGAKHERYVAEACGKQVWLANQDPISGAWYMTLDASQHRLTEEHPVNKRIEGEDLERMEATFISYGTLTDNRRVDVKLAPTSQVVGLVGYAQVGKDTLAAQLVEKHGFQRIAFADVLRECLYALNPLVPQTGSRRIQDLVDAQGWERAKTQYAEVRQLLQRLGTEVGRNILGTDIWVETALKKIQPGGKYVITDVRFPNEFAAIERLGGTTVRILREGYGPVNDHWSEKALDSYAADVTVWNVGTPQDLERIVADELNLLTKTWTKDGVPAPFGGRRALGVEA